MKIFLKIYIFLITFFSLAPIHFIIPNFSDEKQWSLPIFILIPPDKITHFLMYFLLSFFLQKEYSRNDKTFIFAVSYGILMEIIQFFIPYRSFEFFDILANSLGAAIPYLLIHLKKPAA